MTTLTVSASNSAPSDVFAQPFPTSKGYHIYSGANADLLLLRLEDLDRCAGVAFKEFLNIDGFSIESANVSADKEYGSEYSEFTRKLTLPASYIDHMYQSRFMRHFYSADERERFRLKWLRDPHCAGE